MTLRKFIGLFQIGFLDLVAGAFIAHILHKSFYTEPAPIVVYLVGAIIAALPDLDILVALSQKKILNLTHRNTIFHKPLLFMAIPALILAFIHPFWALLWALPLFFHYLHDTVGESSGIQWFSPFRLNKFALWDFNKAGQRKLLVVHPSNYRGFTLDEALEKKFYRLTPTSIIEAILPVILLIVIIVTW